MRYRHQEPLEKVSASGAARRLVEWFAFRPWMLAAAVILACALGIAIMEDLHAREMWAQLTPAGSHR